MKAILQEMIEHSEKTTEFENKRKNLGSIFFGKFTQKMVETKAKADQDFQDAMVAEIKQNVLEVKVLVDKYNTELDLLKEVMSKSLTEKIHEVREDERKQAALEKEQALKKLACEHQAAQERHEAAMKVKDTALK